MKLLMPPLNTYPLPFRPKTWNLLSPISLIQNMVYLLVNLLLLHFEKIPSLITFAL